MREVIIACDFSSESELKEFLSKFTDKKPYLKIGMELFYKTGAYLVKEIVAQGFKVFLDLKLHDIPNTVYKAMRNLANLGVSITNVHAAGGVEMMKAAKRGLTEGATGTDIPKLIAVTQLTSTDERTLRDEILIDRPLVDVVRVYAQNAKLAGLDGIVCSPLEAPIAGDLGLLSVTPGIRFAEDGVGDQKRVTTPAMAKELGSSYIVVGRSITDAANPVEAYNRCVSEFEGE